MKTLFATLAIAAGLAGPALAQGTTTIISEEAPATTTTTTTTVTTEEALPGDALPGEIVTYARENPIDPAPVLEGRIVDGTIVPPDVSLAPVRGYDGYSYFYQDGAPIIVDSNRRVVRIVR